MLQREVDRVQTGHQRRPPAPGVVDQQADGLPRQCRVEGRHRFVGEDQFGLLVKDAGNPHPLQLAPGELIAAREEPVGELDAGECGMGAGKILRMEQRGQRFPQRPLSEAAGEHGGDDALAPGQRGRLRDQADASAQRRQRCHGRRGVDRDIQNPRLAALRRQGRRQQREQGRLAGTGRADERDAFARCDREREVGERDMAVGVGQAHALEQEAHGLI